MTVSSPAIALTEGEVLTRILSGTGTSDSQAGTIFIQATETIRLLDRSAIISIVLEEAQGQGGDIRIETVTLHLFRSIILAESTPVAGIVGNIQVEATNRIIVDEDADIVTEAVDSGDIILSS